MAPLSTADLLNEVKSNFKEFMVVLADGLRKEMNELRAENQELKTKNAKLEDQLVKIIDESKDQRRAIETLQSEVNNNHSVNSRIVKLEDCSKRNNLRLDGFPDTSDENAEQTQAKVTRLIKEKFDLNIDLCGAGRVGKFDQEKPRTILVRFRSFGDRQSCIRSSSK